MRHMVLLSPTISNWDYMKSISMFFSSIWHPGECLHMPCASFYNQIFVLWPCYCLDKTIIKSIFLHWWSSKSWSFCSSALFTDVPFFYSSWHGQWWQSFLNDMGTWEIGPMFTHVVWNWSCVELVTTHHGSLSTVKSSKTVLHQTELNWMALTAPRATFSTQEWTDSPTKDGSLKTFRFHFPVLSFQATHLFKRLPTVTTAKWFHSRVDELMFSLIINE